MDFQKIISDAIMAKSELSMAEFYYKTTLKVILSTLDQDSLDTIPQLEIEESSFYGPKLWIKANEYRVRVNLLTLTKEEFNRVVTYVTTWIPDWEREVCGSMPCAPEDLAIPYESASETEATHILLFKGDQCLGHLPASGTFNENIRSACEVWHANRAARLATLPQYIPSANSPESADTPE